MNNKQGSVEWLAEIIRFANKELYAEMFEEIEQAKAMHKEEMLMFVLNVMGSYRHDDVLAEVATELYEQTY